MNARELHRAVARSTGESVATIARMGFQPLGRLPPEQEPENYIVDWDELALDRQIDLFA